LLDGVQRDLLDGDGLSLSRSGASAEPRYRLCCG
jgi:hypothetical protein